ncbi:MAG: Uma2 family endonuclease, partial [Pseudanabaena sp.]
MVVAPTIDQAKLISSAISPDAANPAQATFVTLDEYRSLAETAEERFEYRNGEIFVMSGGTANHSAIAVNFIIYLGFLLRDTDLRIYGSDMRIWIPEFNCGTYADLL